MSQQTTERRIGFVGIIVNGPEKSYHFLNDILHQYAFLIVGRQGIPYRERNLSIISLIVDGSSDDIGALTGKLGQLPDVTVKTGFAKL
ncbi:iron-only hydrogenase system regulator [candidate division KSB1 bacterium]|nr:iron-only hydrogenase system regulator [candidate division KSB1 bacterium]